MKLPAQRFAGLQIHDSDGVRFITLDRPDVKNAFNDELYDGVRQTLEESSADASVSVCLITGSGETFSAGQDLKALADIRERPAPAKGNVFPAFARASAAFDKPLIAAVNGPAVGVGTTVLLHCDLVPVSETARFKLPFVGLGLVPELDSSALLPATIGAQAAAHLLYTGDWMDAEQAVRQGLAWNGSGPISSPRKQKPSNGSSSNWTTSSATLRGEEQLAVRDEELLGHVVS